MLSSLRYLLCVIFFAYFAVGSFFNRKGRKEIRKGCKEKEKHPPNVNTSLARSRIDRH